LKIHTKVLIIFALAVTVLFSVVILLSTEISLSEFRNLERERMIQSGERFSLDLKERLRPIISATRDWASWTELHDSVAARDPAFADEMVSAAALRTMGLNFLFVTDAAGGKLTGEILEEGAGVTTPVTGEHLAQLREAGYIPQSVIGGHAAGILLIGGRVCFVAAFPIVRSDGSGPAIGTAVGGAFLGIGDIRALESFAGYSVAFLPLAGARLQGGWDAVVKELLSSARPVARVLDPDRVAVYSLHRDFKGRPIFISRLTSSRELYNAGKQTIRLFLAALALAGGVLFFLVWAGLDRAVLSPIRSLQKRVAAAAVAGEPPVGLGVAGNDEVAMLSRTIDGLAHSVVAAEANYHDVVEAQTDLICRFRRDGAITFVNQALCDFVNRPRADLLGHKLRDILPSFDQATIDARVAELTPGEPLARCEDRYLGAGRTVFWLQRALRGSFSESGELVEVQAVISDITENRRAQIRLQESESRYRNLFEHATDGIVIVDAEDGVIWDVNPSLCELLGYEASHFLGREFRKTPPLSQLSADSDGRGIGTGAGVSRMRAIALRTSGQVAIHVDIVTASYLAGGRRLLQWNIRDVSARKRADEELQQLSGRLLSLQDQERRRIARELHDSTGQNLTALQMNLSMLDVSIESDDAQLRELIDESRALCDQCCAEIRTISYLLHPPLLDEVGILFAVKWFIDGFSKRTGVLVSLEYDESIPRLPSEIETPLYRVVQESLNNIHRHSGGTCAWIRFKKPPDSLIVEIEDNGAGINPELLDPAKLASPSLGVGLLGMRERLIQLDGRLEIESASTGTLVRAIIAMNWSTLCQNSESS